MLINYVNIVCPECENLVTLWIDKHVIISDREISFSCKKCGHNFKGTYDTNEWNDKSRSGLDIPNVKYEFGNVASGNIVSLVGYHKEFDEVDPDDLVELPVAEYIETSEFLTRMNDFDSDYKLWKDTLKPLVMSKCSGDFALAEMMLIHKVQSSRELAKGLLQTMNTMTGFVGDMCRTLFTTLSYDFEDSNAQDIEELNYEELKLLIGGLHGPEKLFNYYREIMMLLAEFVDLYPSLLLVENLMHTINDNNCTGDYNKSIENLKSLPYLGGQNNSIKCAYENAVDMLMKILAIPVCLTNITNTGSYKDFSKTLANLSNGKASSMGDSLEWFESLSVEDKKRSTCTNEGFMGFVHMPDSIPTNDSLTVDDVISYMKVMRSLSLINDEIVKLLSIEFE